MPKRARRIRTTIVDIVDRERTVVVRFEFENLWSEVEPMRWVTKRDFVWCRM